MWLLFKKNYGVKNILLKKTNAKNNDVFVNERYKTLLR